MNARVWWGKATIAWAPQRRMMVDRVLDLRAHLGLLIPGEGGNKAHRHEAVDDDLLRRALVALLEHGLAQRAEGRVRKSLAPSALVKARGISPSYGVLKPVSAAARPSDPLRTFHTGPSPPLGLSARAVPWSAPPGPSRDRGPAAANRAIPADNQAGRAHRRRIVARTLGVPRREPDHAWPCAFIAMRHHARLMRIGGIAEPMPCRTIAPEKSQRSVS